jgi:hypothetical protein
MVWSSQWLWFKVLMPWLDLLSRSTHTESVYDTCYGFPKTGKYRALWLLKAQAQTGLHKMAAHTPPPWNTRKKRQLSQCQCALQTLGPLSGYTALSHSARTCFKCVFWVSFTSTPTFCCATSCTLHAGALCLSHIFSVFF